MVQISAGSELGKTSADKSVQLRCVLTGVPPFLSFFCCQIVRCLNALHFRICDVSSESTSIESLADRYAGAWLQLSESFSEHNSMATEIVAIVCAIAVSGGERFTSPERVRQAVACRQAFACSVLVRFHFKSESAQQRRCRFGKLQAEPSIRVRRYPMQPAIADRTPKAGLVFASDGTASWLGRDDAAREPPPAVPAS